MDQAVKTASPFLLSPDDPLNDLRMSAKAMPLYEHVKRFIVEVVNPMSAKYEELGKNRHGADRWQYAPRPAGPAGRRQGRGQEAGPVELLPARCRDR